MTFTDGNRHDAMRDNFLVHLTDPARVTDPQTVAENPLTPGVRIGRELNQTDRSEILVAHGPERKPWIPFPHRHLRIGPYDSNLDQTVTII